MRLLAVLVLVAWLLPLLVPVNFWQQEVGAALSEGLQRPVHVGDIHLQVIGGFGFVVSNIAVEEDPAFGAEPFARAETLKARVALSSLWRGRLEFASIDLISPSFNVVRNGDGRWNLGLLGRGPWGGDVHRTATEETGLYPGALPRVRVESGRINFKSGPRKKAYRVESLELDLIPPELPQQSWRFRLEGMPTRTDLPFHPTTPVRASGEFGPIPLGLPEDAGVPMHIDWSAEQAALAELLTVITGQDFGIHGQFTLRGHAAGTTSLLRISAEGEIENLHRWDLLPASVASSLRAELAGVVDLAANAMELTSLNIPLGTGSVVLRGRIEDIFNYPRPRAEAELLHVPLSALAAIVPQFTTRIGGPLQAEGELQGRLRSDGFSSGLFGTVEVSPGLVQLTEFSAPLRFSAFPVHLEGTKLRLGPVRVDPGPGAPAEVSWQWDATNGSSLWQLRGKGISVPAVVEIASGYGWNTSLAAMPEGELALRLDITTHPANSPRLAGWAQISGAVVEPRGVSQPLRIASARFQFQRNRLEISSLAAELGPLALTGSAVVRSPASTPAGFDPREFVHDVEFTLHAEQFDLAELAAVFAPPPETGYFFGFGRTELPPPTRLDSGVIAVWNALQARGTVRVDAARYGGMALENVAASLALHDRQLEIPEFSAEHAGGHASGTAAIYFAQAPLSFTLDSRFANLPLESLTEPSRQWSGAISGKLSGGLHLAGSGGTLEEIASQLHGSGQASGTGILFRNTQWAEVLGLAAGVETGIASFTAAFQIGKRVIHIPEMRMIPAPAARLEGDPLARPAMWWIRGAVGFDQELDVMVQRDPDGSTTHWAGSLEEPQLIRGIANAVTARANTATEAGDASLPPK